MTGPVLIAGFHRSGTSAVARGLHAAGLHLGDQLLGAEPANPYGHFEDEKVIALHDGVLDGAGLTWKSLERVADRSAIVETIANYAAERARNAADSPWGVKDPRLCLFLDEWIQAAPTASVVFVVRSPGAVVDSLHRRHVRRHVDSGGIDPSDLDFWRIPDLGLKLWLHYHREALPTLRTSGAPILRYPSTDLDARVTELSAALGLPGAPVAIDRDLGQPSDSWVIDDALIDEAQSVWNELMDLAGPQPASD